MAYTQNFAALDGTVYTLTIDGVTVQTPPPLAADPMTTEEDADTDMFMPVRTQSGYVRLLSKDKTTWRAFIPASAVAEPVTLAQGNTIVWQGYVQTGTFGMPFPADFDVIELPLIDMLGVLDSFDVDVTGQPEMVTIGELLAYIFGKLSGLSVTVYFMTQTVSSINQWLQYSVTWRNFLNNEGSNLESRFSCLGVLQELCKFFGWSCRSMGAGIYFCSITDDHRNTRTLAYTLQELAAASGGTGAAMQTLTLADSDFTTTDHNEEYIPGIKKATVNSELNPYSVVSELPAEALFLEHKWDTPALVQRTKASYRKTWKAWVLAQTGISSYEDAEVTLSTYVESADTEHDAQCYGRLVIFDEDTDDEEKTKYNWTTAIECSHGYSHGSRVSSTPLFQIETKASHIISSGVLYINTTRCDLDDAGKFIAALSTPLTYATCTLRIGTAATGYKYWTGTQWDTTATTFQLPFGTEGINDRNANVSGAEYSGYGIAINQTLAGTIYFAVNDVWEGAYFVTPFNGYFPMINFEIGFIRAYEDKDLNDKNYTATGGTFPEAYDVDTIFSTDKLKTIASKTIRCRLGYGLLFSGTQVIDTIQYGGASSAEYLKPEQQTANLIAAYGSQVRRVLTVSLHTSTIGMLVGPAHRIVLGGVTFYPVAVSHRWWDDVTQLTLMSL